MGKVCMDVVVLFVIVVFVFSGILIFLEVFFGFSDLNVIFIVVLFIIGDGFVCIGVVMVVGIWLVKMVGSSEIKMLVLLMIIVVGFGVFMSLIGVVVIFIFVVFSVFMYM